MTFTPQTEYAICALSSGSAALINLEANGASGYAPPHYTYKPYSKPVVLGDGTVRGVGWANGEWFWDVMTRSQRDWLRTFIPGQSSEVYIRTRTMDNSDAYSTFSAVAIWPIDSETYDITRRSKFTIKFQRMQFITSDPVPAPPTPAVLESVSFGSISVSGSSITWAHTIDYSFNKLLTVLVGMPGYGGANSVTSVKYGGASLTRAGYVNGPASDYARSEIWYLIDPAQGTNNIVVTTSGIYTGQAISANWSGVNQTVPLGPYQSGSGVWSTSASFVPSGSNGDVYLDGFVSRNNGLVTCADGQTKLVYISAEGVWCEAASMVNWGVTTNLQWSMTAPSNWVLSCVAIKPV